MFRFIKQEFIGLLSFRAYLATKCTSFNNEPCMTRYTLIDLNPVKFNYYSFMISLFQCSGIFNAPDDLSTKVCVPSKIKDINVKVSNMITRINQAKTLVKHVSCDCKCKLNSTHCNSKNRKWDNKTCQCECKNYRTC